jgi:hypothetical protein
MHVVLLVAGEATCVELYLIRWLFVAALARKPAVGAREREARLLTMIELKETPAVR